MARVASRYRALNLMAESRQPYILVDHTTGECQIALPHECAEWVVGGPNDTRQFIETLRALADRLEGPLDLIRHPCQCPQCGQREWHANTDTPCEECEWVRRTRRLCDACRVKALVNGLPA